MMMEPQFPDAPSRDGGQRDAQGIVWYYGHGMLGHSGGDPGATNPHSPTTLSSLLCRACAGVSTYMGFVPEGPEAGTGIVMLSNLSNGDVVAGGGSVCEQALLELAKGL